MKIVSFYRTKDYEFCTCDDGNVYRRLRAGTSPNPRWVLYVEAHTIRLDVDTNGY